MSVQWDWEVERMQLDSVAPFEVEMSFTEATVQNRTWQAGEALSMAQAAIDNDATSVKISRNGLLLWRRPCVHDFWLKKIDNGSSRMQCAHCGMWLGIDTSRH